MTLKRVVVTGLGAITPIGNNISDYWNALINGVSGAAPITYYDTEKHKTKFACEVKDFNIEEYMDRKEARRMDKFAQYAVAASHEAIADAGITDTNVDKQRVGVIWGAGIGGLETFQEEVISYAQGDGTPRFNPFFIPNAMIDAFNYIRLGMCDVIISGGSEAAVTIAGMGGFNSMQALSTRNDSPETASRPFDATRDGFVLGEGAGALVLEEYEHAKARGAKIYCEIGGGGMSSDAYHLTAPHPEGIGVIAVMNNTLRDAGMKPEQVDHINTHGTSTPLGDVAELKAISAVFGSHAKNININSTKSMTGHLLGAAGAIEAIASILAMKYGIVPPTINHTVVDENIDPSLNLTLNKAQKREINVAMSNTFGFGGHNACVLFKKLEA